MLNAMIRRVATFISDAGLVVLHTVSLLKTLWFVAAFAGVVIYWGVFVRNSAPSPPPAGPGQYSPPSGPVAVPSQPGTAPSTGTNTTNAGLPPASSAPAPQTSSPAGQAAPPVVVLPPRQPSAPSVPAVQASAGPNFTKYAPPPVLPPLEAPTPGIVRGWQAPRPDPYYRPY